jgi:molecular chaperone HscB
MKLQDDDFTLLGLPQRQALDRSALDAHWRALQAQVHPDRFAADGAAAQRVAMQWAMRVNEAYRRLKDPIARGRYLCELRGVPAQVESNTAMPAAFLHQQMAWREALEEAADAEAVRALAADVGRHERELLEQLRRQHDDDQDPAAAATTVRMLMFVTRFGADIDRRLEALEA